ncbi:PREDICTED: cas scaffolding protein family member 4 [Condylura cristata]|uniref:cas scaffolding protein family member 4 n=1 Tax=Condylura cristata TaxID=143302 RepID=UPI000642EF5B|nr:PREDICTED: cas scaffolding protein family member 4 [Condylura cristata]
MRGASTLDGAPKVLLARALYDNCADCADELAFSRGDILTILEQNVPESEGWWKCLLHGKLGLAPANRLQVLMETPEDRPCPPFTRGLENALASPGKTGQAPTQLSPAPPGPVYEPMRSWVKGPPPAPAQDYEFPNPLASASVVCEKALRGPTQKREEQILYDIPASAQKARWGAPAGPASVSMTSAERPGGHPLGTPTSVAPTRNGQSVPLTSATALTRSSYSSLPNPQKSEWTYDTPTPSEKASARNAPLPGFLEGPGPHAQPWHVSSFPGAPNSRALPPAPHLPKDAATQKKLSLPESSCYGRPAPRDALPSGEGTSYRVPASFLAPRVEQQNTRPNIYDLPTGMVSGPQPAKEHGGASEAPRDPTSLCLSRRAASLSPELDRLSASSSDSRASVVSSGSSVSTDSLSSSSEEPAMALPMDQDAAKETAAALEHRVASCIAGLMLFVNRRWRSREYLEANVDAIRRAVKCTEGSLREFLDFARAVARTASQLPDGHLQARVREQVQLIAHSHQILLETKDSLESLDWSLEVLVADKVQTSPDDLERFVMAARMVPEDVKRFASIVIANGRLLFKQNCEREETELLTPSAELNLARSPQLAQREHALHQSSPPLHQQRESGPSPELFTQNRTKACDQSPGCLTPRPSSLQKPEKRIHLSEHSRLYFGALFKAINTFSGSLHHSQPPTVFITRSKAIIVVGQKLVDTLCKETQDRDARNEVLCGSNHLCSLLKGLALATKQAVIEHPSPAALRHLQAEIQKLEQHARQFRGMLG